MEKKMDLRARKRFIINCTYCVVVALIVIGVFRYAIFWLMPFVLGFAVAFVLKPPINTLVRMTHLPRRPVAALVVLLFYATIGVLITLVGFELLLTIKGMIVEIPYLYTHQLEPAMMAIFNDLEAKAADWDPQLVTIVEDVGNNLFNQLGNLITNFSRGILGFASGVAVAVPGMFISVIFTVISSFFIAMDYYKLTHFIVRQFSPKHQTLIFDVKDYIVGSVFKFITSYAMIMSVTFIELCIGLSLLGIENAPVVAFLIAMVDVLPVLGTGGVVIPWILIEVIVGKTGLALGLLVLYLFITIMRNVLEPKIVGTRVGLHPVVMLLCMFIGVKLFGALGILILPFMMVVVKNLNDSGRIHIFK